MAWNDDTSACGGGHSTLFVGVLALAGQEVGQRLGFVNPVL